MEENDDDADPTRQKQINRIKEPFLHSSLKIILYDAYHMIQDYLEFINLNCIRVLTVN